MDWVQFLTFAITMLGAVWYLHKDHKEEMKAQAARTDKLYEMFIDLLKEQKGK